MPDRLIRSLNGPRGAALLAGGMLCLVHAIAYSPLLVPPSRLPHGIAVLTGVIPMNVWVVLWAAGGPICAVAAFRRSENHRLDAFAWGGLVGMLSAWSLGYLGGWVLYLLDLHGDAPQAGRGYIAGSLYLCVAIFAAAAARMRNPKDVVHLIRVRP